MDDGRVSRDRPAIAAAVDGDTLNVQVTRSEWPQNQPSVQVSGLDPRLVVVASNDYSTTETRTAVHRSTDGGRSFSSSLLPRPAGLNATVDPAVDFGFRRRFLIAAVALNRDPSAGQRRIRDGTIVVYPSNDDARTFDGPIIVSRGRGTDVHHDTPFLSIDKASRSPYFGRAYLIYTRFMRDFSAGVPTIQWSDDGGYSWSEPVDLSDPGVLTQGSRVAVGRQGEVYVTWIEVDSPTDGRFRFRRSDDGGVSFSSTITVEAIRLLPICREGLARECLPVPGWRFRTPTYSFLAVDHSRGPGAGTVYAVWPEFRRDQAVIWLSRSLDDGDSWSEPIRVSGGGQAIFPNIAVSPATGNVYVLYIGNELSPQPGTLMDAYVAEAPPGGRRFARQRISSQSFDPNADPFFGEPSHFIGDYTDLTTLPNGGFIAVWTDTRTGNQDVFAGIEAGESGR